MPISLVDASLKIDKNLYIKVEINTTKNLLRTLSRMSLFAGIAFVYYASMACATSPRSSIQQRYELTGKVISIDKAQQRVVVAHEPITGFMVAMTMPFTLKEAEAYDVLAPGDRLSATLVVDGEKSWLENPAITKAAAAGEGAGAIDEAIEPSPGDAVPDLSLVNQDGKPIRFHQFQGKALVVTFIYTRCPLPEYCPLMSSNFAEINQALGENPQLRAKTHLLSISVDPAHDSPQVLRRYGAAYVGDDKNRESFADWEFATGTPQEVQRVAQFFGLSYYTEGDQIVHSLRTAVVTPEGSIFKIYKNNEWKPADVVRDLESLIKQ